MKRKLLVLTVMILTVLMTVSVAAAVNKSNTGCGLGYLLFKDADDSTLLEVFAVTTNGTSGNQTFGITTGTLECGQPASFVENERVNEFVAKNMDNLAADIASGQGESLDTFAELIGVPAADRATFNAKLQKNFDKIFTSSDIESAQVIDNIAKIVS